MSRNELLQAMFDSENPVIVESTSKAKAIDGDVHEFSVYIPDLAGGQSGDGIITTGDKVVVIDKRVASYTGDGVIVQIYESPTFTGGNAVTTYNKSRVNNTSPLFSVVAGVTVTDKGILAFADEYLIGNSSNQGAGGTALNLNEGRTLKPNTDYLLRVQSLDNQQQAIAIFNSFYEQE